MLGCVLWDGKSVCVGFDAQIRGPALQVVWRERDRVRKAEKGEILRDIVRFVVFLRLVVILDWMGIEGFGWRFGIAEASCARRDLFQEDWGTGWMSCEKSGFE